MKKNILLLSVILLFVKFSNAQLTDTQVIDSTDSPKKYYFQDFLDGIVYLKSGQESFAKMNYQMQDQSIAFIDTTHAHLILSNLEDIDSVRIDRFTYLPVDGKFFELLIGGDVEKQLLLSMFGKSKPMSTTVEGRDVKTVSKNIVSDDLSSAYITRTQKRNTELNFLNNFWIKEKSGKLTRIKNIKQVVGLYPSKKDKIIQFDKENKTNFNDVESVSTLIRFCDN